MNELPESSQTTQTPKKDTTHIYTLARIRTRNLLYNKRQVHSVRCAADAYVSVISQTTSFIQFLKEIKHRSSFNLDLNESNNHLIELNQIGSSLNSVCFV